MAAWFAGEKHSDKPECVCPVLGAYGVTLNDAMPGSLRDRLLKPLVPLVVGTHDPENEQRRAEFLVMSVVNKIVPIALRASGLKYHAIACEQAGDLKSASAAAAAAAAAPDTAAYNTAAAADTASYAADYVVACTASVQRAAYAVAYAAAATAAVDVWPVAVECLRQAIMLGKHEGKIAFEQRHAVLRELVRC